MLLGALDTHTHTPLYLSGSDAVCCYGATVYRADGYLNGMIPKDGDSSRKEATWN